MIAHGYECGGALIGRHKVLITCSYVVVCCCVAASPSEEGSEEFVAIVIGMQACMLLFLKLRS